MSRFQFVDEHRTRWSVKRLCAALEVSTQGYYQWKGRAPARAAKTAADQAATARIKAAHRASKGAYGAPRITVELREAGEAINRKRVARLDARRRDRGGAAAAAAPVPAARGPCLGHRARPARPRLHRARTEHALRRRHHLSASGMPVPAGIGSPGPEA